MGLFKGRHRNADVNGETPNSSPNMSMEHKTANKTGKYNSGDINDYPVLTFRTFFMTILVAMGGFIFGYDTGQISGFLEMDVFLEYFGELGPVTAEHPTGYFFSNVRSGLIVGLVYIRSSCCTRYTLT